MERKCGNKNGKNVGGSEQDVKTYNYSKEWSSDLIDSSKFKEQAGHENPSSMAIKSQIQYAKNITLGDYKLTPQLIKQIRGTTTIAFNKVNTAALKNRFRKPVQIQNDQLYIGEDEQTPKVGDIRVSETAVYPQDVSVIARQSGDSLQAYMAPAGQAVILLAMGQISPQEMIRNAATENRIIMWLLRLASLILLIIGLALMMNPIAVLADFIPFFGSLVRFGTGFIAFTLGLCLWLIAISIAWFAVRPLISVCIIAVVVVCSFLFIENVNPNRSNAFGSGLAQRLLIIRSGFPENNMFMLDNTAQIFQSELNLILAIEKLY